jgi:hypothetical protein
MYLYGLDLNIKRWSKEFEKCGDILESFLDQITLVKIKAENES